MGKWLVRIDVGGTFTDGWARSPEGDEIRCKVLSSGIIRTRVAGLDGDWVDCECPLSGHSAGLEGFTLKSGWIEKVFTRGPARRRISHQSRDFQRRKTNR